MVSLDKSSNESPSNEVHLSEKNTIVSPSKPVTEVIASSKKDLSYIFKLDVTKKKLESINRKLEKLSDISLNLIAVMDEKNREYQILEKIFYDTQLDYLKLSNAFLKSLDFYGFKHVDQIINADQRELFLKNLKSDEDRNTMIQIMTNLRTSFADVGIQKAVLDDYSEKMKKSKQEMAELGKQLGENQKLVNQTTLQFQNIDKEGLLASYEVSGNKSTIKDFIAHPLIETQLKKLITMYTNKSEMTKFGLSLPKGILFIGESETGKTLAAKVLASEIDRKMYHIKAHDLFSEDVNDPNAMLYTIFYNIIDSVQKTKEPCIIFLDEIEKIIASTGDFSLATEKMISNTIIKNIVNIQKSGLDIIVLAALTQKNKIDERFLKYDLFDNQFFFDLPREEERKRLFESNIQKSEKRAKLKLFDPEMLDALVKKTDGFSAKYIKQLIDACVKEYLYNYIQNKPSFAVDHEFIGTATKTISSQRDASLRQENAFAVTEKQKALNAFINKYTMKQCFIFGDLEGKKKNDLSKYILETTETYTEIEFNKFLKMCADEYPRKKASYHKQYLIQKEFVLQKIEELKSEDKIKGKRLYFNG